MSSDYHAMEQGHPYGVQPMGNAYSISSVTGRQEHDDDSDTCTKQTQTNHDTRGSGLGPFFKGFNDLQILEFLEFLDGPELARLSQCSQAWYAFCHHNDLWKQLFFKEWDDTEFDFEDCWKISYIKRRLRKRGLPELAETIRHKRLKVRNMFSDILYQPFLCASMPIQDAWVDNGEDVERVSAHSLSIEEFRSRFENPNRPVIITDLVTKWPAYQKWNRRYLLELYGDTVFSCGHYDLPLKKYFEYSDAAERGADDQPLYLFDKIFPRKDRAPGLAKDYDVPEYFSEDLFSLLGEAAGDIEPNYVTGNGEFRPDYRWLIVGPAKSGSVFHIDPNATSAWNAVIRGSKRWILYPPEFGAPPGVHVSEDGADVATPMAITEWYASFFSNHQRLKRQTQQTGTNGPLECTVREGELLFVPHHWFHQALNLESDTIAVTQNYVSSVNLPFVLEFLKNKPGQVSGLPNEEDGKHLHQRFLVELQQKCPAIHQSLEEDKNNREAERKSKRERQGIIVKASWNTLVHGEQQNGGDEAVKKHKEDSAEDKKSSGSFSFNFTL